MSNQQIKKDYQRAKRDCPGAVCLFRAGDFYESYFEDAAAVGVAMGLAITKKGKEEDSPPMSGFAYHRLESCLTKLVAIGHRVAVLAPDAKPVVRQPGQRLFKENVAISKTQCHECGAFLAVVDNQGVGTAVCPDGHGKVLLGIHDSDVSRAQQMVADLAFVSSLPEFRYEQIGGKCRYIDSAGLVYRSSTKTSLKPVAAKRLLLKGEVVGRWGQCVMRFTILKKQPKNEQPKSKVRRASKSKSLA